jgi:hypothetical protein
MMAENQHARAAAQAQKAPKRKNAASLSGSGVLFDHDT